MGCDVNARVQVNLIINSGIVLYFVMQYLLALFNVSYGACVDSYRNQLMYYITICSNIYKKKECRNILHSFYMLHVLLYFSLLVNITCSRIITVKTPITKPLPIRGRSIEGITCIGIMPKSRATIMGRPIIRP